MKIGVLGEELEGSQVEIQGASCPIYYRDFLVQDESYLESMTAMEAEQRSKHHDKIHQKQHRAGKINWNITPSCHQPGIHQSRM